MSYLTIDWIQYWKNMICWQHRITAYICLHAFLNYGQIQSYRWTSDKLGTFYEMLRHLKQNILWFKYFRNKSQSNMVGSDIHSNWNDMRSKFGYNQVRRHFK